MEAVKHPLSTLSSSGILFTDTNTIRSNILSLMRAVEEESMTPLNAYINVQGKYTASEITQVLQIKCTQEEERLLTCFITLLQTQGAAIKAIASTSISNEGTSLVGRVTPTQTEYTGIQASEIKSTESSDSKPVVPEEPKFLIKHKNTLYKVVKVGGMITAFVLIVLTYKKA